MERQPLAGSYRQRPPAFFILGGERSSSCLTRKWSASLWLAPIGDSPPAFFILGGERSSLCLLRT